jgi:hypothetical protein
MALRIVKNLLELGANKASFIWSGVGTNTPVISTTGNNFTAVPTSNGTHTGWTKASFQRVDTKWYFLSFEVTAVNMPAASKNVVLYSPTLMTMNITAPGIYGIRFQATAAGFTDLRFGWGCDGVGVAVTTANNIAVKNVMIEEVSGADSLPSRFIPGGFNGGFGFANNNTFSGASGSSSGTITIGTRNSADHTTNPPAGDMVAFYCDSFGSNNDTWPARLLRNDYSVDFSNPKPLLTCGAIIDALGGRTIATVADNLDTLGIYQGIQIPRALTTVTADADISRPLVLVIPMGVNDFSDANIGGYSWVTQKAEIIALIKSKILRAFFTAIERTSAKVVVGADIVPFGLYATWSGNMADRLSVRQSINDWLYTLQALYPWLIIARQAAVIADPAIPTQNLPAYDFDGLHVNPLGHRALADFYKPIIESAVARAASGSGASSSGGLLSTLTSSLLG